jgi:nicotinate phosphoribosyltransferase
VIALVDYHNDCVQTSFGSSQEAEGYPLGRWGVRLGNAGTMVDRSLWDEMMQFDPRGVNVRLVEKVREALDREGFSHVKIVVSGGFNPDKIASFEEEKAPADIYAVGSFFWGAPATSPPTSSWLRGKGVQNRQGVPTCQTQVIGH